MLWAHLTGRVSGCRWWAQPWVLGWAMPWVPRAASARAGPYDTQRVVYACVHGIYTTSNNIFVVLLTTTTTTTTSTSTRSFGVASAGASVLQYLGTWGTWQSAVHVYSDRQEQVHCELPVAVLGSL